MNNKFLLTATLIASSLFSSAQENKLTYAITGDGNNDFVWMNIRQVDLTTGQVTKTLFQRSNSNFSITDVNTKQVSTQNNFTSENIFTALNINIINRLKTIENISYVSKKEEIFHNFDKDNIHAKIGDNSFISPSFFNHNNSNTNFYLFGGINLYAKKYLDITENIILSKMKHDNTINIKKYFENDLKQKIINPVLYNIELLLSIMLKEFKKQYDYLSKNINMLEYINTFLLVVGKEYNSNGYIANALKKIHNIECKKFILNAQIINPHINLKKFEKELRISQILTMNNNGGDIWLSIRNEFSKKKIETLLRNGKFEQEKHILQYIKIIFSSVLEQKNKLECIPNSLKLFGIIHHNVNRL
jgi:hypothetical protein